MRVKQFRHELISVEDYNAVIDKAIVWLGDRHLLARPISASTPAMPPDLPADRRILTCSRRQCAARMNKVVETLCRAAS